MGSTWAFAFLILYPAVQVPLVWLVVRRFDLRNDDGPRDPVGYADRVRADDGGSGKGERPEGRCPNCGGPNDPVAAVCRHCLTEMSRGHG